MNKITEALEHLAQKELDEHVRPEIQDLARRGQVTIAEAERLRFNSWEWEHIVPALSDDAFAFWLEHAVANSTVGRRPFTTYNEAVVGLYLPELLKRFRIYAREARDLADAVDDVRQALGQDEMHYLIIGDDAKELVEAVELCASDGGCRATKVLEQIRARGRIQRVGS